MPDLHQECIIDGCPSTPATSVGQYFVHPSSGNKLVWICRGCLDDLFFGAEYRLPAREALESMTTVNLFEILDRLLAEIRSRVPQRAVDESDGSQTRVVTGPVTFPDPPTAAGLDSLLS